jgi:hypothetical protein
MARNSVASIIWLLGFRRRGIGGLRRFGHPTDVIARERGQSSILDGCDAH